MKIGINIKLIFFIVSVILIFSLVLSYFIINSIQAYYIREYSISLFTQANFIINSLRDNLNSKDNLNTPIDALSRQLGYRIILTDDSGIVRADSKADFTLENQKLNLPEVNSALRGTGSYGVYNLKDIGPVIYLSSPILSNKVVMGTIFISSSLEEIYSFVNYIKSIAAWISATCIVISIFLTTLLSSGITKRLSILSKAAKKISLGDLETKVDIGGNDEIKDLSISFNQMAAQLNIQESKRKQFIANISHEIKTPLASIKALCEALTNDNTSPRSVYKDFLSDIIIEVDRLTELTQDFLNLAKLEGSEIQLNVTPFDLAQLLEATCHQMTPYAQKNNIEILYTKANTVFYKGDREKLKQVIINIIDNGIKYSKQNSTIEIQLKLQKDSVLISIKDNGIGIAPEHLNNIFDYFFRADQARTRDTGGTGLGLKIAQRIVKLHNGNITVQSGVNKGTTFNIFLPL